jgi:hypothetical protein
MTRLPAKTAPFLFGFFLSGLMSMLVSAIATVRVVGFSFEALAAWPPAWLTSWLVAFPIVLVVAPIVRRLVSKMVLPSP